ncbi:MAG: ATP-dependent DNA helicase RecG [Planctomycetes bacterium]|nr:ATP-dependent DNA helicase RecG [Planctomycetota bacterium]
MTGEPELQTPVQYVKGVGPVRAVQLAQLGIQTAEDLLTYFPKRFDLRRQVQAIGTVHDGEKNVTIAGEVIEARYVPKRQRPYFECSIDDGTGSITVKWFHGGYLRNKIAPGVTIAVSGAVRMFDGFLQLINPALQILYDVSGVDLDSNELLPVYPAGAKLSSGHIASIIKKALPTLLPLVGEWHDGAFLSRRGLLDRRSAIAAMHHPEDTDHWKQGRRRLAYDECMLMQLALAVQRASDISRPAHAMEATAAINARIRARFPFQFTAAQNRAVVEISADLARPRPMNRLLQGDVGAGKTVVALYAALTAIAHRKQVALMAPTEILAAQHYRKVTGFLAGSRVRIALLVGAQPEKSRRYLLAQLKTGEIDLVVGTHALLGKKVKFKQLGLVIVDEQHKFGVDQRSSIRGKGYAPHYLVMTATPIPRTLALTVFGDLDVSTIDELPPGRGKTQTRQTTARNMPEVLRFVCQRLAAGQQAYFIYPLVNTSEKTELKAAISAYEQLRDGELSQFKVALVHGQMKAEEKDDVMNRFAAGEIQALVASVVIEVGIDVPNANVMVIEHAERFGLAQLHQLRGRIGRGRQDAVCFLVASAVNPIAKRRLEILCQTADGFKIAEEDLRLRGPGEFFGTRQHGLPELKVADLIEDFELLRLARRDAFAIVNEDPALAAPHHQALRHAVIKTYGGRMGLITGG